MSEATVAGGGADPYLESLKAARKTPAVLKLKLAQFRSHQPDIAVFAFEGDDDKIVYAQWTRRVRPTLPYEPFVCNGKKGVLELHSMLLRDRSGLLENVYFFVDRDFDDLRGKDTHDQVFMTDMYAVENYLVDGEIVNELLKNEFHCHSMPDVRSNIVEIFAETYNQLLEATKAINGRIFIARRMPVEIRGHLPKRIGQIANVEITRVSAANSSVEELIPFMHDPTLEEAGALLDEFERLDGASRYRGKFALVFFQRWLALLAQEYSTSELGLFSEIDTHASVRSAELVLSNYASISKFPHGFSDFIERIPIH
jgi:hypothetical protein